MATTKIWMNEPGALGKLERSLADASRKYSAMKQANRTVRHKKWSEDEKIAKLQRLGYSPREAIELLDSNGYPRRVMQRQAVDVSYLRNRVEWMQQWAGRNYRESEVCEGVYEFLDPQEWRVGFIFDDPPSARICAYLQRKGFIYAPSKGRWQRALTEKGRAAIKAARLKVQRELQD